MEYNARRFSIFRPVAMHHPAEHSPLGKSSQYVSQYAPELLRCDPAQVVSETLHSHLLKSNCPVTHQPDWGTVVVEYQGARLDHASFLAYLVSFRQHADFHEQCVERIVMDIWTRCQPIKLSVYARYTRRGGLDINPLRTSHPQALPRSLRNARQ